MSGVPGFSSVVLNHFLSPIWGSAEGINTTKAVHSIAGDKKIDLPITEAVYSIIYNGSDPMEAVKKLMSRKFKSEV